MYLVQIITDAGLRYATKHGTSCSLFAARQFRSRAAADLWLARRPSLDALIVAL